MRLGSTRAWALIIILQLLLTLGLSNALTLRPWDSKIGRGANAASVDIGGLTPKAAAEVLASSVDLSPDLGYFLLTDGEQSWSIRLKDIDFSPDFTKTADLAYSYDRQGSVLDRVARAWEMRLNQAEFPLQGNFSNDKLEKLLSDIGQDIYLEPQPARIESPDGNLSIFKEQPGRSLNVEASIDQIRSSLNVGSYDPIPLVQETLLPAVKESDLKGIHQILAVYTTIYNPNDSNRSTNVEIAARSVNGILVQPGELFSLNEALGPRVKEKGYKAAPVFSDQKLVKDIGGGICQVATTLYNALLQTRLEIKERWPHSSPITYAPLGLDATLAGDEIDLKFSNSTSSPVYISTTAEKGVVTVTIYGTTGETGVTRRIVTEKEVINPPTVVKYDETLPRGESKVIRQGKEGYKVKVYRITEFAGQETARELLSDNYYRPQPTLVSTGDIEAATK